MMDVTPSERCRQYRLRILEISQQVPALHVAPAFSAVEIVDTIYNELVEWDLISVAMVQQHVPRDIFIMSKGHAAILQYVVLEERGILRKEHLDHYCKPGGHLGTHPDLGVPGIEAATGSLGHGLGIAVGMAYAEKLKGSGVRVYVLLSDGECQEGSTWEAVMMAANLQLDNLTVFIDNNDFSGLAKISETHPSLYPLEDKFHAFGWGAVTIDGHNSTYLEHVGAQVLHHDAPTAIVCQTVKGKGVSFMENEPIWHYRSPNAEEYQQALKELEDVS